MQNMLEKGHDKAQAEEEFGVILHLLRFLGHGRLSVEDGARRRRCGLGPSSHSVSERLGSFANAR